MKFDDNYRAATVVMLQAEGYPDNPLALGKVHNYLAKKAPYPTKTTLSNWFRGLHNAPPSNVLDIKKDNMTEALYGLLGKLVSHANKDETIGDMSGQAAVTSIGILIDKLQLLEGNPTEITKNSNLNINASWEELFKRENDSNSTSSDTGE